MHRPRTKPHAAVMSATAARALTWITILAASASLCGCQIIFNLLDDDPPPSVMVPPPQQLAPDGGPAPDGNSTWRGDPDVWRTQPRNTNQRYPTIQAALRLGNAANVPLVVRVRALKPTVLIDCKVLLDKPHLALSKKLFGFATTWLVEPGRAVPLGGQAEQSRGCGALLIDGGSLVRRLVVWDAAQLSYQNQPSTVGGAAQDRLIGISAGESGFKWPDHPTVFPAPFEIHPPLAAVCQQPDETVGVAWTEPLPKGDVTVIDVAEAPDGCRMLDLFGKTGVASWVLCTPPGSFPFQVGESFFVNALTDGHNLGKLEGVEILSKGFRLRVGRGEDVVYFGKGQAKVQPIAGCGLSPAECGGQQRSLEVAVTLPTGEEEALRADAKLELEKGRTLYLMRARELPIADLACIPGGKPVARQVESVYVEVQ